MGGYTLLEEAVGRNHIEHMLGRVVIHPKKPVDEYAPDGEGAPNPEEIIPKIQDHVIEYPDFAEVVESVKQVDGSANLLKVLEGNFGRSSSNTVERSATRVVRYKMVQHPATFAKLMKRMDYKNQVILLHEKYARKRSLLFVTGVVTAQNLKWSETQEHKRGFGLAAWLPFSWLTWGQAGDIEAKINYTTSYNKQVKAQIQDEVIIALSYDWNLVDEHLIQHEEKQRSRFYKRKPLRDFRLALGNDSDESVFSQAPASELGGIRHKHAGSESTREEYHSDSGSGEEMVHSRVVA